MAETGKYDDILHLPHHVSPTRPRMTMAERAAQFSPFAALTGHDEAIRETGRVTVGKIELGEDEKAELDQKQRLLLAALERGGQPPVTVTYFQPDQRKEGGEYRTAAGAPPCYFSAVLEKLFRAAFGKRVLIFPYYNGVIILPEKQYNSIDIT